MVCRKRGREKEKGDRYIEKKGSMFKREKIMYGIGRGKKGEKERHKMACV
jgi:hypothetical protein